MVKLTRNDYRVGARVKLTEDAAAFGISAKAGATATVVGIGKWLQIEWDRNELSANQSDGGYSFDQFQLDDGPW